MNLTVVLCTYKRDESLSRALNSAAALTVPESIGWEILVVDNNSTDHTSEVCEEFCRRDAPSRQECLCLHFIIGECDGFLQQHLQSFNLRLRKSLAAASSGAS